MLPPPAALSSSSSLISIDLASFKSSVESINPVSFVIAITASESAAALSFSWRLVSPLTFSRKALIAIFAFVAGLFSRHSTGWISWSGIASIHLTSASFLTPRWRYGATCARPQVTVALHWSGLHDNPLCTRGWIRVGEAADLVYLIVHKPANSVFRCMVINKLSVPLSARTSARWMLSLGIALIAFAALVQKCLPQNPAAVNAAHIPWLRPCMQGRAQRWLRTHWRRIRWFAHMQWFHFRL